MQPSLAAKPGATLAYRKGWRLVGPANCVINIFESQWAQGFNAVHIALSATA
jgi:hypothetical protein